MQKLKKELACLILQMELQDKHFEKQKLKKDFREINISITRFFIPRGEVAFNAIIPAGQGCQFLL